MRTAPARFAESRDLSNGHGGTLTALLYVRQRSDDVMRIKTSQRTVQAAAKPVGQKVSRTGKAAAQAPAVVRRGRLSLQQIKHAAETALRGQTFEADA